MQKLLIAAALISTLAGCGAVVGPTAPRVQTGAQAAAQTAPKAFEVLALTSATRQVVEWPEANNGVGPHRLRFTIEGRDAKGEFSLVVTTFDNHAFYVATLDTLTLNGKRVTDVKTKRALSEALLDFVQANPRSSASFVAQEAAMIVLLPLR